MKNIKFSYLYRGVQRSKYLSVREIAKMIGEGKYARQCEQLAETVAVATTQRGGMLEEAEKLPVLTFGQTDGDNYTGYVLLSFRCGSTRVADEAMRAVSIIPQTLMAFRGSSRQSLKIVVPFCLPDGTVPFDPKEQNAVYFHQYAYRSAALFYREQLGLEMEMKSARIDSGCRVSSDSGIYLNENAVAIVMSQPVMPADRAAERNIMNGNCGNCITERLDMKTLYERYTAESKRYDFCLETAMNEYRKDDDEEGDLFVRLLAVHCLRNGVRREFAVKRLLLSSSFQTDEVAVRKIFSNIYRVEHFKKENCIPQVTLQIQLLKAFIKERYHLRRNCITGSVEYIEEGMCMFDWQPLTKELINRMTLNAIDEGIEAWDKDVKRYVESNYVPDYDPIYDYLHALPQWDGRDRVTDVAYRVPTDDDGWARYFHTWMLAMVNQWSGGDRIYGNSMVPLLVGSQGDGKSTFCKRILPPELHDYYAERLDFSNRNEAERALTRFALINIDEYDSITPRQGTFLKHILQKSSVMSRKLYQSVTTERQRYSAFIGTTNDPTPLTDPTGSRRYLCIKTTGTIDNDTPIDYPQLYAQLMAELKRGDRDYFSTEEETKIQRRNVEFQEFDSVEEIFSELFRKPEEADEGHFVNVMAILKTMKQKYPIIREDRKTAMLVGKMLKRKGFVGKHSIAGTRYNVVAR